MITKKDALCLRYRQELYFQDITGKVKRCRVNGKTQTWVTRPTEFKVPMKYGLKHCFYLTHENAHNFYLEEP